MSERTDREKAQIAIKFAAKVSKQALQYYDEGQPEIAKFMINYLDTAEMEALVAMHDATEYEKRWH